MGCVVWKKFIRASLTICNISYLLLPLPLLDSAQLLQQRSEQRIESGDKTDSPEEWLNRLPQLAKHLEAPLYRTAPSLNAYNDTSTLVTRLQQVTMKVGMKMKIKMKQKVKEAAEATQPRAAEVPPKISRVPPPPFVDPAVLEERKRTVSAYAMQDRTPPPFVDPAVFEERMRTVSSAHPPASGTGVEDES